MNRIYRNIPVCCVYLFIASMIISMPSTAQQTPPRAYSATAPVNFVRTWDAKATQTDPNKILSTSSVDSFLMTTQYVDGLGRPIQTVGKQMSPSRQDMVTASVFDSYGREQYKYLPFVSTVAQAGDVTNNGSLKLDPFQQQAAFFNNTNSANPIKGQGETYFYGQTAYEASPLNRSVTSYAPGNSWVGSSRGVQTQYLTNTDADSVRIWVPNAQAINAPTTTAVYAAGQLDKTVAIDENGKQVVEYKDKEGHIVLKKVQLSATPGTAHMGWLCTYYVYSDMNNLRAVLQPKLIESIVGTWSINTTQKNEYCFLYGYDSRHHMDFNKVPGAQEIYMIYDGRDRLVMTQDGKMRAANQWLVTLYDDLNRPVQTGLVANSSIGSKSFLSHEAAANAASTYPFNQWNIPASGYEMLTQNGYDSYDSIPAGSPSGTLDITNITATNFFTTYNAAPDYAQQISQSLNISGLPTWSKVKVLNSVPANYLYTVNIFDDKGRLIQVKSTNYTSTSSTTGIDVLTTQYDFSEKIIRTHLSHQKSGTNSHTYYVLTKNSYDHCGRILSISKRANIDGGSNTTDKVILKSSYDEIGELKKKIYGASLDSMTYDYNIRGWLLGGNRAFAKDTASSTNYFGFELAYDNTALIINGLSKSYTAAQYNGNIAGMLWKSNGDDQVRKYDFVYDAVNRLTSANFTQLTNQNFSTAAGLDFSTTGLTYDANGNILTMVQKGWKLTGSVTIDSLKYNYLTNSNRLQNVLDLKNDTASKLGDFKSSTAYMAALGGTKSSSATDYSWDVNGNMTSDRNKDIGTGAGDGITYNFLNLPQSIWFKGKGRIDYVYDAVGNKLIKTVIDSTITPVKLTTTLYMMGIYQNDTLQFIGHEAGRMRPVIGTQAPFVYDYFIKDHLGNVRMTLTEEQKQDVYPAATLEGSQVSTDKSMLNWEKQFYTIDNTKITGIGSITGFPTASNYPNNNGNPPANSIASGAYPVGYTVNDVATNSVMYKVNGNTNKTGLGFVVRVMAGDHINIFGKSYYYAPGGNFGNSTAPLVLSDILNAFVGSPSSPAGSKGLSETNMESLNSGSFTIPSSLYHGSDGVTSSTPKAYINYIFFDDQMRYAGKSGFSQVGSTGVIKNHWNDASMQNIAVPKNGYLYVYVSNESPVDVYFDNLQVVHDHGLLVEESHYYPFGLAMAGISSKASVFGGASNKFKYNGGTELENKEFSEGSGLELYATEFRSYDPQLGRFHQIDPLAEIAYDWSPYSYAYDNPIYFNDPSGLSSMADSLKAPDGKMVADKGSMPEVVVTAKAKKSGAASAASAAAFETMVETSTSTSQKVNEGGKVLEEIFKRRITPGVVGTAGLTILATIWPLQGGADFPNGDEMYWIKQWFFAKYKNNPQPWFGTVKTKTKQPYSLSTQEPDAEVYYLLATESGLYPNYTWGKGITHWIWLQKGEIWKIGKTVNGPSRYTGFDYFYTGRGVRYQTVEGPAPESYILFLEQVHIRAYQASHGGQLPPGNTKRG